MRKMNVFEKPFHQHPQIKNTWDVALHWLLFEGEKDRRKKKISLIYYTEFLAGKYISYLIIGRPETSPLSLIKIPCGDQRQE